MTTNQLLFHDHFELKSLEPYNEYNSVIRGSHNRQIFLKIMLHVFNSSTKGVSHSSILNRLFAKTKICQLHVTVGIKQNIFGLQISVRHIRMDFRNKVYPKVIM